MRRSTRPPIELRHDVCQARHTLRRELRAGLPPAGHAAPARRRGRSAPLPAHRHRRQHLEAVQRLGAAAAALRRRLPALDHPPCLRDARPHRHPGRPAARRRDLSSSSRSAEVAAAPAATAAPRGDDRRGDRPCRAASSMPTASISRRRDRGADRHHLPPMPARRLRANAPSSASPVLGGADRGDAMTRARLRRISSSAGQRNWPDRRTAAREGSVGPVDSRRRGRAQSGRGAVVPHAPRRLRGAASRATGRPRSR